MDPGFYFGGGGGGGGGGPGLTARKQSGPFFVFFSPQLILQFTEGIQWFYNRENYTFEGSRRGPTFSGGSNIFHGGSNANFYRNPYNLCFSRGGGPDRLSPLWIRTCFWVSLTCSLHINMYKSTVALVL